MTSKPERPLRVIPPASNTVAERIQRLQAEARTLASGEIQGLIRDVDRLCAKAVEIANGGEAYPPGVRDVARRMAEDMAARAQTLEAILARTTS